MATNEMVKVRVEYTLHGSAEVEIPKSLLERWDRNVDDVDDEILDWIESDVIGDNCNGGSVEDVTVVREPTDAR